MRRKGLGFWARLGRSNRLFPRKLKLNTEGRFLVFITIAIGFAAVNTGNNLLYLILGMLLSLITVSGILSELTLRDVTVSRVVPSGVTAGRDALVPIKVHNGKRFFASLSIEVEEIFDDPGTTQLAAYVLHLRPGEEAIAHLRVRFTRRGEHTTAGLRVATRFPFSFFRKSRLVLDEDTWLVYPPVVDVPVPLLPPRQEGADQHRPKVGHGDELWGVRDYRPGDPARSIHWKLSARRGRLVSREFETPSVRTVMLAYPNAVSGEGEAAIEALEAGIVHVASVAAALLDRGYAVGLRTLDGGVSPSHDGQHRTALLSHLARLRTWRATEGLPPMEMPGERGVDRILVRPAGAPAVQGTWDHVIEAEGARAV
ncbi:MAG: hypothetical protein AMXMBFR64_11770 [Myxococcales bacterium]